MYLSLYNESIRGAGMDLVFFTDAMVNLIKVSDFISCARCLSSQCTLYCQVNINIVVLLFFN